MITVMILFAGFLLTAFVQRLELANQLDSLLAEGILQYRTPELDSFFILISDIGSIKTILPAAILLAAVFLYKRNLYVPVLLIANVFLVRWLNHFIKGLFGRERPQFEQVVSAGYYSFPSGHSMNSAAFYGFVCFLLVVLLKAQKSLKSVIWITGIVLVSFIGLSRIYLGVHYPVDVIGGFCLGGALMLLFIKAFYYFDKNRNF
ncbi:phosphatase PAP2 family protein [Bacillus lacus]|uniref:Phosphatase PAP2 family protein n=1 Tax=Metabacillus lacus TaxID=1983721 RepID=A0A7X2J045_9BACI|nr:phosphatase PAP2 family protein [Metabacillus lacus]MRX72895.1 phosphatase PAP2 family protein [Metabacillus lacus]